jgi:hypothetical protein
LIEQVDLRIGSFWQNDGQTWAGNDLG